MKRKQYSDRERAEALAILDANNGNLSATVRITGIPIKTLSDWRDGRVHADVAELRIEKKQDLAERFEELAHKILDILPGKLNDGKIGELATAAAIAVDKAQLLRNKPTQITGDINFVLAQSVKKDLIEQLKWDEPRAVSFVAERYGVDEKRLISDAVN